VAGIHELWSRTNLATNYFNIYLLADNKVLSSAVICSFLLGRLSAIKSESGQALVDVSCTSYFHLAQTTQKQRPDVVAVIKWMILTKIQKMRRFSSAVAYRFLRERLHHISNDTLDASSLSRQKFRCLPFSPTHLTILRRHHQFRTRQFLIFGSTDRNKDSLSYASKATRARFAVTPAPISDQV
jgi:hypothetical protein